MVQISVFIMFKNYRGDRALVAVLTEIKAGRYAPDVRKLRQCLADGDKTAAERIKKGLPAFTVSALYNGKRLKECLTGYNPLLILDLDGLSAAEIERLRALIEAALYTVACFLSPGGAGLKVIVYAAVRIEPVPENHRVIYDTMKAWYETLLDVGIDASGSDAGRLCFVSDDSGLFISPRFSDWLNDTGQLPDDMPLLDPVNPRRGPVVLSAAQAIPTEEAPAGERLPRLFANARSRTSRKGKYEEGNRNNYVYQFGCHCNRLGISQEETAAYCNRSFPDLPGEEIGQALDSAYSHQEEKGQEEKTARQDRKVENICRYLTDHYTLRYNVVRSFVEWRKRKGTKDFAPVTDYWENSVWCAMHLEGIQCLQKDLHSVILSDFSREYNPFTAYFKGLPAWDGVSDHIARLAATVTTDRPDYWLMCLRKWLVATVACAVSEKQENHSVLLLSGAQGIGKTTWCRHLVPPSLLGYVYSGNIDPSSKDAPLLLSDCFLIILDELSGQSRMELNRLKAMITKDSVYERRSYARNAETYTRRASFLATVNDSQVLTDRTGSRRFLCFEAQGIDYATPVDHAGIYSQALALYRSGFKFWFSGTEITEINLNNEAFQQSSPEEELFYTYFRKPVRFEAPSYLSSSEILAKLALFTRLSITSMNVINLGKILKKDGFEQIRRHGKRLYSVVELTFDQVKAHQMGISSNPPSENEATDKNVQQSDCKQDTSIEVISPTLPF